MYLNFFGLNEQPFQLTPDSHFLYLSDSHMRAKAYMDYTVWKRDGFVVITGEVGAGKTTLIHKLLGEVQDDVKLIRIFQTQLNEMEFLQAMLVELGFDPSKLKDSGKVELINLLNTYLLESYQCGKHVVLIVDEAQNLSPKVLEEIRLLSGLEPDKEKILNVILVGQPELNDTLSRPDMEQLVQRIRLRFHVGALNQDETWGYITHRMTVAGAAPESGIFDSEVLPLIYEYTGGIPRKINILCDTALICAFADTVKRIDTIVMQEAISELQWKPATHKTTHRAGFAEALSDGEALIGDSPRYNQSSAPKFAGGDEQWGRLFSLLLRMMSDMSFRMKNIDEKLLRIEANMAGREASPEAVADEGSASKGAEDPSGQESSDDYPDDAPTSHLNSVHIA
ncbi:MAG: AAA family ATPase [Gammaproteobacteria bacterium]|nr:AAA family ATPase [Gammaproteobacteria bacterium]